MLAKRIDGDQKLLFPMLYYLSDLPMLLATVGRLFLEVESFIAPYVMHNE
ncbi:hypothetical protein GNIT_3274 [Glaciecola nitratireducens FR1064]|uniref:Uncharacterized protein n=1 Tax=Glaciecola nitratireducens (strain JCM 12485 / KCTC 12276 / FR1064) TaxID=1085623 RepID=G4QE94_GLANF|nr:hypothetical protein GNIT_3274 [Glaciecola nitratireducens FR1064]